MQFYSAAFLLFFGAVLLAACLVPLRWKNPLLLLASYAFYASWGFAGCLILLGMTALTYFAALLCEKKHGIFVGTLVLLLALLCQFKYGRFLLTSLAAVLPVSSGAHSLPQSVGISFFTFQAVGYLCDVRRGKYPPERNFWKIALFLSFFPQLLSGPIGRGDLLLPQYAQPRKPTWENLKKGSARMLWGYFLKLVIADRAAILVDQVYSGYENYAGICIIFATVIYGLEIYCDFAGYSHMAIGAAEMLGIRLSENFRTPYFAQSIREFWRRWHISLSSWFRDYLYIPLGGSRGGKLKTARNTLVVFLVSGLWHGAGWNFLLWGGLHGLYQVIGKWTAPVRERALRHLGVQTETESFRMLRMLITFCLVDFAWLFFRADGIGQAFAMLRHIVTGLNPFYLAGENWYFMGLNRANFHLLFLALGVLLGVDCLQYQGISLWGWFSRQGRVFRGMWYVLMALIVVIFGVWGSAYHVESFIYFQF